MKFFYWLMAILIAGTFIPSAFYLLVYAITGENGAMDRARRFWNLSRVFGLGGQPWPKCYEKPRKPDNLLIVVTRPFQTSASFSCGGCLPFGVMLIIDMLKLSSISQNNW